MIIYISIFVYIKLYFPFWSKQPVVHFYDLYYMFNNFGIINCDLPKRNKYVNLLDIEVYKYDGNELLLCDCVNLNAVKNLMSNKSTNINNKEYLLNEFVMLINNNYFRNAKIEGNRYEPLRNNIIPYFDCHKYYVFLSFYWINDIIYDTKNNSYIYNRKHIGVMSSRPLQVYLFHKYKNEFITFDIYYVDYLCVDKMHRGKNVASQIIQTHEYIQRHTNKNISISLFKHEENLLCIVPLCCFDSYCWSISDILCLNKVVVDTSIYEIINMNPSNTYYFYQFIDENKNNFNLIVVPVITNLIELVKSSNIIITFLLDKTNRNVIAYYIFKNSCIYLDKNKKVLTCIASIKNNILNEEIFIDGFIKSLSLFYRDYFYVSIEDISENNLFINYIRKNINHKVHNKNAYFFYNFAYQTFHNHNVFIIN